MDKWPGVGDRVKIVAPDDVPFAGKEGTVNDCDMHDGMDIANAYYAVGFVILPKVDGESPVHTEHYYPGNYLRLVD